MELFGSLLLTLRAIHRNSLRSALTLLGIAIGVAMVITMVAVGTGAQRSLEQQIRAAGAHLITVTAGNFSMGDQDPGSGDLGGPEDRSIDDRPAGDMFRPRRPVAGNWAGMIVSPRLPGRGVSTKLSTADVEAVERVPGVRMAVAGVSETAVIEAEGGVQLVGRLQGTDAAFAEARGLSMRVGTFLTPRQVAGREPVVVLSQQASRRLFGSTRTPVGKILQTRRREFTVIGVVERDGALTARAGPQFDDVYVPYTALQDLLRISHLHSITVAIVEAGKSTETALSVTRLLRERHTLGSRDPDDFVLRTPARDAISKSVSPLVARAVVGSVVNLDEVTLAELASSLERSSRTMTALLVAVASVSLLIGGIGILNVMLVAVTERTREIGLRMALGARNRDVLVQFLTEATTLSLLGGMAGVLIGVAASEGLGRLLRWTTVVTPISAVIAVGAAAAVGVFFGFYPAQHASRLDPIEALRFE